MTAFVGRAEPSPLALEDVVLDLAGRRVLDGVSLTVAPGQVVGLLGRNGAGKSSLLHVIAGLRRRQSGLLTVAGCAPGTAGARAAMTVVLQDVDFPVTVRVGELLRHVARHFPDPLEPRDAAARLGLDGCWDRQAGGLSGGESRKLAVACALVGRPAIVLLDEPFAGLDAVTTERLWHVLTDVAKRGGAVLLSSHELVDVQQRTDRVVLLDGGRVVADGSPRRLADELALAHVSFRCSQRVPIDRLAGCLRATVCGDRWVLTTKDADRLVEELVRTRTPFTGLLIERLQLGAAVDTLLARRRADVPRRPEGRKDERCRR